MNSRYQIQGPDITFEAFEAEILVINLNNGSYHSLRGAAVQIWPALVAGYSPAEIAGLWSQHADHASAIATFAQQLRAAALLVPRTEPSPTAPPAKPDVLPEFSAPLFESYTDMQDLLMLDPIHEVDMAGWPKPPESNTEARS